MRFILSIHPFVQFCSILLAFYAGYLGFQRTRSLHFGQRTSFKRDRHAACGTIALSALLCGWVGGMTLAHHYLPGIELGLHGEIAGVLVVLLPIGLGTGLYLYFNPGYRKVLPALHAINNLVVLILLIAQIVTGLSVYQAFVPH